MNTSDLSDRLLEAGNHKFFEEKCIHCGVSLAVSGYSEACPVLAGTLRPRQSKRRASRVIQTQETRPEWQPPPNTTLCIRCNEWVVARVGWQSEHQRTIGTQLPGGHVVFNSIDKKRMYAECPKCGSMVLDDQVQRTNERLDKDDKAGNLWLFAVIVLIAVLVIGLRMALG